MSRLRMLMVVIGASAVLIVMSEFVSPVQARTPLGGLGLHEYCLSLGFDRAILTEPQIGEHAACDPNHCINLNWHCLDSKPPAARIDMTDACEFQYDQSDLTAWPFDPHDAFTWVCYSIPSLLPPPPPPPSPLPPPPG
jgi:hypothetical protein